ncbi:MAG: hypothetical protein ACYDEV_00555 [Acidiferrobacter sp.]
MDKATCIECGCDDDNACVDGCFWLRVDYGVGLGVCSECGSRVADWDRGNQTLSDVAAMAVPTRNLSARAHKKAAPKGGS